jgi:hypothetical protein
MKFNPCRRSSDGGIKRCLTKEMVKIKRLTPQTARWRAPCSLDHPAKSAHGQYFRAMLRNEPAKPMYSRMIRFMKIEMQAVGQPSCSKTLCAGYTIIGGGASGKTCQKHPDTRAWGRTLNGEMLPGVMKDK